MSTNCTCAACIHRIAADLWRALAPVRVRLLYPHSCASPWQRGVMVVRWGSA